MKDKEKYLDERRITSLLLEHHGFVFRQARRYAPIADIAEDVVQQVFLEFLGRRDHWDTSTDLRPLLAVITRRVAQRMWRERARLLPDALRQLAELIRNDFPEIDDVREDREERKLALRRCLGQLPETGRRLISCYYFEGVSTEVLAEQLQKKANAVTQAMFRLREKLRICIDRTLNDEVRHA